MAAQVRPFVPLLPYQRQDVESDDRFRWCCWARQTGKSFTKSLRRLLRGLQRGRMQVLLSAGERQSAELMQKVRQHCQALAVGHEFLGDRFFKGTSFRQLEVARPNGVRIVGLPANPQTARGFTGDVLLDEFAMHASDRDIWAAMFPTILRGGGGHKSHWWVDVASTPKGRKNVFFQLQSNERFSRSTVTLPLAIEQGLTVDLEDVRRSMGDEELFRQEFLPGASSWTTAALIRLSDRAQPHSSPSRSRTRRISSDAARMSFAGKRICPIPYTFENSSQPYSRRIMARSNP